MESSVFIEDFEYILADKCIPWEKLKNSNILVTGATGLICSTAVKAVLYADTSLSLNLNVFCIVRDVEKANRIFFEELKSDRLKLIHASVEQPITADVRFDYIIHGASPTASGYFVEHPVETMQTAIFGTRNMLERAKLDQVKGFLYLSSMEAYGNVKDERVLKEDDLGTIDLSNVRNCYPESKRVCEMMCVSYAREYQVPATSIRLAQTFGPGVSIEDKRVFAMMARCAMNKEDIILLTKGTSKHPYLYTAQAVTAMLCVLLTGASGEIYNAANPNTYCSIYEMGQLVAEQIGHGTMTVRIAESDENAKYPPASYLNLSIEKISALGWSPSGSLIEMYTRMIRSVQ